ncbi:hypothetical protein KIN20_038160 [Parelaphostrongylus tenuis]|uniref:Uncharacterized protein n=1 Tax=Parelaphostrongylus tenuis TaxID=148309 RepID=A0AAD5RED6_PARTN|nr:hypothetical protein KIN20_038160 [Parelaphostrongylus tenuis]
MAGHQAYMKNDEEMKIPKFQMSTKRWAAGNHSAESAEHAVSRYGAHAKYDPVHHDEKDDLDFAC